MTLIDLPDSVVVSIDFFRVIRRLTDAELAKDVDTQNIINLAIHRLNNLPSPDEFPFEPIMTVGELKKVFTDYYINPLSVRIVSINNL